MISVLRAAREAGIELSLAKGLVKVRSSQTISPDLIAALRAHKDAIRSHLQFIGTLEKHSTVLCPAGCGSVWEIYNCMQKIGVIMPGEQWPLFYHFEEVCDVRKNCP